jgi:hypothetical protein
VPLPAATIVSVTGTQNSIFFGAVGMYVRPVANASRPDPVRPAVGRESAKSRGGGRLLSWSKTSFNANLAPSIFKDLTC